MFIDIIQMHTLVRILSLDHRYILLSTQNKQKLDVNV